MSLTFSHLHRGFSPVVGVPKEKGNRLNGFHQGAIAIAPGQCAGVNEAFKMKSASRGWIKPCGANRGML